MGYYARSSESTITISAEQLPLAIEAIAADLNEREENEGEDILTAQDINLLGILDQLGFSIIAEESGSLYISGFYGKLDYGVGEEQELFIVLAPYITPGSYMVFVGEDLDTWRWFFQDGRLIEQHPVDIIWG